MARPRRPYSGVEDIKGNPVLWMKDELPGRLGVRREREWNAQRHLTYKAHNGLYDPLTYLHILDVVCTIDPDIELRTGKLVDYLRTARKEWTWDVITVGKVLADLSDAFEDVLGVKQGLLDGGKDYRGRFYLIRRNPDVANVYYGLRVELHRLALTEMYEREAPSGSGRTQRLASPLLECASVRPDVADLSA